MVSSCGHRRRFTCQIACLFGDAPCSLGSLVRVLTVQNLGGRAQGQDQAQQQRQARWAVSPHSCGAKCL